MKPNAASPHRRKFGSSVNNPALIRNNPGLVENTPPLTQKGWFFLCLLSADTL